MLEALESVERLGEVNRLFFVLSRNRRRRIKETTLVETCRRTAGLATQYPRPKAAIAIAIRAGLLKASRGFLTITERGRQFASKSTAPTDLSRDQGRLLLSALLDDPTVEQNVSRLLDHFEMLHGRFVARKKSIEQTAPQLLFCRLLQQLGAVASSENYFVVTRSFNNLLKRFVVTNAVVM